MTGKPRIPRSDAALPEHDTLNGALSPIADKDALRKHLLQRRRGLDPARKAEWDGRIGAAVLAWCLAHEPATLGVYWPLPGEPDLHALYGELARLGMALALPVVVERAAPLGFAAWTPGQPMHKDRMGVAVPLALQMVAAPPALLVPCLGFNAQRFRLGYGGGYYDRTLEAQPRPATLGVAYSCMQAEFGGAAHDVALDAIATENGTVTINLDP